MTDEEKVKMVEASLDDVEKEFIEHSRKYARETAIMSMTITRHSSYQKLLSMGYCIVPYMIKDLVRYKDWSMKTWIFDPWCHFNLLHSITNEWPARQEDAGRLGPIMEAWIKWGEKRGIIKHEEAVPRRHSKGSRFYMGCCKVISRIRGLYQSTRRS